MTTQSDIDAAAERYIASGGFVRENVIDFIPTVSRWLGHRDSGALAMRTYGHLRDHHSTEMAQRVTFQKTVKTELTTSTLSASGKP